MDTAPITSSDTVVLARMRAGLLGLAVLGMVGTGVDLVLLGHYEDAWQWPPLVLVGLGLAATGWAWRRGDRRAMTILRLAMGLFIVTGVAGVVLHLDGNMGFQREMDPSIGGWSLFVKVVQAKAPPALAPAAMAHVGLLGLLYTCWRPRAPQAPSRVTHTNRSTP